MTRRTAELTQGSAAEQPTPARTVAEADAAEGKPARRTRRRVGDQAGVDVKQEPADGSAGTKGDVSEKPVSEKPAEARNARDDSKPSDERGESAQEGQPRRRRRNRAIRRVAGLTLAACVLVGGVSFLLHRKAPVPAASAASALPAASSTAASEAATNGLFGKNEAASSAVSSEPAAPDNALGLTAEEASAMLADPLMVLVNHANKMPDNYTFDTKECGSSTSVNKTLQTVACDAFLAMQKAAAADGVTVWMQSGYRSVSYQTKLYERKTQYYRDKGYDEATAKEKAAKEAAQKEKAKAKTDAKGESK